MSFNWTCPYCGQPTTITDPNFSVASIAVKTVRSKHGKVCTLVSAIACPNEDCKGLHLTLALHNFSRYSDGAPYPENEISEWTLMPRSRARPWPDYIPLDVRNSYIEACLIAADSPKASAALARRCLQGIVRDFWEIPLNKRGNLGAELSLIREKVDSDTWEAIQAVRSVGDIGAHMEKDVNLIVDVQAHEADLLIGLIETLLDDWYVERHKRRERNAALAAIAKDKLDQKRSANSADAPSRSDDLQK
jgi:hypothetical protein